MFNTPFVQAPLFQDVKNLLDQIPHKYVQRGSGHMKHELDALAQDFKKWILPIVDLQNFAHCYSIAGVTDAINQFSATTNEYQSMPGDYEWLNRVRKGTTNSIDQLDKNKTLYLSIPQCYNGNFVDDSVIDIIDSVGCDVVVDCAYIGATAIRKIRLPVRTTQVWFGFSKGWGLIGNRLGLAFTTQEHPTLNPMYNVECFNYTNTKIMHTIIKNYSCEQQYNRMHVLQKQICDQYNIMPSDTYFLATSTDEKYHERRRLGNVARLCITEMFSK